MMHNYLHQAYRDDIRIHGVKRQKREVKVDHRLAQDRFSKSLIMRLMIKAMNYLLTQEMAHRKNKDSAQD